MKRKHEVNPIMFPKKGIKNTLIVVYYYLHIQKRLKPRFKQFKRFCFNHILQ